MPKREPGDRPTHSAPDMAIEFTTDFTLKPGENQFLVE